MSGFAGRDDQITRLFDDTFTASEGPEEGRIVSMLAARLMAETSAADLRVFTAMQGDALAGCIMFSRMWFGKDLRQVWLLSPVAVRTDRQGQGVGQALLRHGLVELRGEGGDVALTYGSPDYYGKTGFKPIDVAQVPAPYALRYPHGWLGQSLDSRPLAALPAPARCVVAFEDAALW